MACFHCPISNARQCGPSCGLCGSQCPGVEDESLDAVFERSTSKFGEGLHTEDA